MRVDALPGCQGRHVVEAGCGTWEISCGAGRDRNDGHKVMSRGSEVAGEVGEASSSDEGG